MKVHPMWDDHPALREELIETLALIEQHITIRNPAVRNKISSLLKNGGKFVRPAYCLLFSHLAKERKGEQARAIAAALEVLHVATLVHDDVVDDALLRRNQETLNATYSNRVAIYTGDYLFTVCFQILKSYADEASDFTAQLGGMETILLGELNQLENKYNQSMRMRDYLRQVKGKTAELFALSCYAGAFQATRDNKLSYKAYRVGEQIGMAFQIIDDNLDYTLDSSITGKPVLQDVRNGIYTAPLLYALKNNRKEILPYLAQKEALSEGDAKELLRLVECSGGIEEANRLATTYTHKALKHIQTLPKFPERETISIITEQMLTRSN